MSLIFFNLLNPCSHTMTLMLIQALAEMSTYGKQVWGTTSTSNIEVLERFQRLVEAKCYNTVGNGFISR
jgi:hypothetical protein